MSSLAQQVSKTPLRDRIFSERQLGAVVGGGEARRYGLVNRALKDGSLIRVKRGTYMLGSEFRGDPVHPFVVAQALMPGSYVSFESALAFHGWIPEAVFVASSVTPGRKTKTFAPSVFGPFGFHPLALEDYQFLVGVERASFNARTALVAQPLRALLDLVALRRITWSGLEWLTDGMRIDMELLLTITQKRLAALRPVYKHKGVQEFLSEMERAIGESRRLRARIAA